MQIVNDFLKINYTPGGLKEVRGIVMHSTWGNYWSAIYWFKNPEAKASAHYIISKEGQIRHMVNEGKGDMAWHSGIIEAGVPGWVLPNPNYYTIGIELEDMKNSLWYYPVAQREAARDLVRVLMTKYGLSKNHILLHRDLCPSRRTDPVGQFSLDWLLEGGVDNLTQRDCDLYTYKTICRIAGLPEPDQGALNSVSLRLDSGESLDSICFKSIAKDSKSSEFVKRLFVEAGTNPGFLY